MSMTIYDNIFGEMKECYNCGQKMLPVNGNRKYCNRLCKDRAAKRRTRGMVRRIFG